MREGSEISESIVNSSESASELQQALPQEMITRNFEDTCCAFKDVFDLKEEIAKRAKELPKDEPLVLLDAGCGAGVSIEQALRILPTWLRKKEIVKEIQGIGIDFHPAQWPPRPSSVKIAWTDPETGFLSPDILVVNPGAYFSDKEFGPSFHTIHRRIAGLRRGIRTFINKLGIKNTPLFNTSRRADIRSDDITKMETIPDNSVDIGYSQAVLQYTENPLKALEEGFRVLKPGGMMVWQVIHGKATEPPLQEILNLTPEAKGIFQYIFPSEHDIDRGMEYAGAFIVCRKPVQQNISFHGFPFTWQGSKPSFHPDQKGLPATTAQYTRTGIYNPRA